MTKADIARAIAKKNDLNQKEAVRVIDAVLEAITQALARNEKVELRGFGSFGTKRRGPRQARNPKTGVGVSVPAKAIATFKPSKAVKKLLTET